VSEVRIDRGALFAAIEPIATAALTEIAEREVPAIELALSVPVTRDFAGRVVERSKPGEPPRMEEDILRQNGSWQINQDGESFVLTISWTRPPEGGDDQPHAASILEFGGVNQQGKYVEPRPFMAPALERISGYALEVVERHFGAK
jgi:hypothetical protein